MVDSEPKDFKAVKVQFKGSQKTGDQLSRSMLYSGINIFGQLSQAYIQSKESGQDYQQFSESIGKGKGAGESSDGNSMMNISQEVLAIFKRLQKKDSTTKIKAFQELERYVDSLDTGASSLNQSMMSEDISASQSGSDEIQNLLTFFLYHFCRIVMNEPDRKVREAAHITLAIFIKKAKRRLGPHLKRIFSLWFCSFFDVSQEVASLAKRNFENAFPEGKRDQVFKIAFKNFLLFANEQLQQSEDQISESVADLSKAQREDIFDRITSSVLLALAKSFDFTKDWSVEERTHFQKKMIDILDLSPPPQQQIMSQEDDGKKGQKKQAVHQSYLWSFLQSKYRGRVRAACLQFISSLLLNLPKDAIEGQIQQLAPLVHNLVSEDNSQLQSTLWRDALFSLGKNFPNSWESTNIKKNFLPKLYSSLKGSGFGSPQTLYENFVKFVSIFPLYHLIDYHEDKLNKASFKERCNLLRETLTNLYLGLKNDESVAFHQDLMKCYSETFAFILLKRVQPLVVSQKATEEDKDFAILQMKKCIQLPLEDFINNYEKFNSKVQNQRNIRSTISSQLAKLFKDLAERQIDQRIFNSLIDYMMESILLAPEKPNVIRVISALLKGQTNRDTPYFKESLLQGFILKYAGVMAEKVAADVENLGKENIDQAIVKSISIQKTLYKLNKFEINSTGAMEAIQTKIRDSFTKVAKKEELASKVLTPEILVKFKALKENLLKSVILSFNLEGVDSSSSLPSFVQEILNSKNLEINSKTKVLMPDSDFKKLKFGKYYKGINEPSSHSLILEYITVQILGDEKVISHYWSLIDSGLSIIGKKPSFIMEEDKSQIAIIAEKKLASLKPSDFITIQYYISAIRSILSQKDDSVYERIRELLFDKILQIKSTHPTFQPLWTIYSAILKTHLSTKDEASPYLDYCVKRLKEELTVIIQQKGQYNKKGAAQFDAINRFTLICRSFVSLLPSPQHFIETILLDENLFTSNLSQNCLPLKMFRDLFLAGGLKGGFDVSRLFSKENGTRFVWLAGVLLNVRHLPSLANFVEMKKQLVIFVDTEVLPLIINQAQAGDSKIVIDIVSYMAKQGYVHSLEQFIHKMVDPGEDYPAEEKPVLKVEDFKQILQIVEVTSITQDADYSFEVRIFLRVLREISYYVLDSSSITNLYAQSTQILKEYTANEKISTISGRIAIALEIYQSTSKYLGEDQELRNQVLIKTMQPSSAIIDSYHLNAILDFIAHNLESMGVSQFTATIKSKVNFQGFISWLFETQQQHHLQPLTYIHMLQIIRKTINAGELISDRNLVVEQVIDIAKDHALSFEIKVQKVEQLIQKANQLIEDQESKPKKKHVVHFEQEEDSEEEGKGEDDDLIEDFEYELLQEVAETMIAMTNLISPAIDENNLFILISSGVESLQKAAFVLLKQLYENFIPAIKYKIDDSEMLLQIKQEAKEQEVDEAELKKEEEEKGGEKHHHHDHEKVKNKLAFRNISDILIEILENPPAINHDGSVHQQHVISGSTHIENLIFNEAHSANNKLNSKVFGYLMAWNAMLIKIENGRIKSQLQNHTDYSSVLGALNEYLEENDGIYRMLLVNLLAYLPEEKRGLQDAYNVNSFEPEYIDLSEKKAQSLLTIYTLLNFMKSFPSLARKYFQECDKQLQDLVMPYIKQIVSPAILENEIKKIEVAQLQLGQSELKFSLFKSTKEILASFTKGEIEMTLKIKIPADYPLKLVEVDVSRQLKISEKQLRKWILAIRKIIQFQNGDIISAVLAWKANIEREIEGVEDCYICYCVVHENDQSLPKMPCKTCKNKFHVACIRKWFRQSHKSNCPICQNYFF